jgi:predicted small secreted protein
MRKIKIIAIILIMPLLISGCNTLNGIGKDVIEGGSAITKAAR